MSRFWFMSSVMMLIVCFGCATMEPTSPQTQEVTPSFVQTPALADGPEQLVREPHPVSLSDLHRKYRSTFVLNGSPDKRQVALTFDDAPDAEFTPQVLDVLKEAGVRATFFVVGNRVEAHPQVMTRIVAEGHAVGNHSYNHANLPKLSDAEFRDQIIRTDRIIQPFTGEIPRNVRPPYGNISENQIKWLASRDKKVINWNVDSLDWKGLNAKQVATNVLSNVEPGAIVLQHSGGGEGSDLSGTVEALPEIINKLQGDNVSLVTIPELLDLTQTDDSKKEALRWRTTADERNSNERHTDKWPQINRNNQRKKETEQSLAKSDDIRYPNADELYEER